MHIPWQLGKNRPLAPDEIFADAASTRWSSDGKHEKVHGLSLATPKRTCMLGQGPPLYDIRAS